MNIWDVVLTRDDGTCVGLHPNCGNTNVEFYEGVADDDFEIPNNGKGGSNSKGYFQRKITQGVHSTLKFDASKKPSDRT